MPLSESESRCFVRLFATPRTIQSMEFSRPEYWNGYYAFNLFTCSSPQSMHVYVLGWPKKSVLFPVRCYLYVFMYIYTLKSMCVYIYTHTHTHTHTHTCMCVSIYMQHAKSLQLCPTLCGPMDRSPPGSSVHGILRTRILEWVAMIFSSGSF